MEASIAPVPSAIPSSRADPSPEVTVCQAGPDPAPAPEGGSIAAAIAIGCEAGSVAVAGDSVWMVPHLDRVALRIDPTTNAVVEEISLGDRGPGAEIDATDEMVWVSVSSPSYDLERLVRLDPVTGSLVASIDVAAGFPHIGARFVWATGSGEIYRIDPTTNSVAGTIETTECAVITLDERALCIGPNLVATIDPMTDALAREPDAPALDWPLAAADGLIWGITTGSLWAFDPRTLEVVVELEPPAGTAAWSLDSVIHDGDLWMSASSQPGDPFQTAPDRLVRIDTGKLVTDCIVETPNAEYGMASGFGSIWVPAIRQPWLVRIEPTC
jgi:hypothetical protein